ncbi:hypothetical protein GY45DRAFT_382133 [Cubamyces sp. BRFM 1775]|nr:hypothetical protein GY45DRAFT_382133 [Cubamyces sp. BRFM 1775]
MFVATASFWHLALNHADYMQFIAFADRLGVRPWSSIEQCQIRPASDTGNAGEGVANCLWREASRSLLPHYDSTHAGSGRILREYSQALLRSRRRGKTMTPPFFRTLPDLLAASYRPRDQHHLQRNRLSLPPPPLLV